MKEPRIVELPIADVKIGDIIEIPANEEGWIIIQNESVTIIETEDDESSGKT